MMKVYIKTFRNFDVICDSQSLISAQTRQYRLYRLFQYFISYRNKTLSPETIIDNLFPDNESADPKSVLRTQIFRLRRILKSIMPKDEDDEKYITIHFINGHYILKTGENISVDTDEFELLVNMGNHYFDLNEERAIETYIKALSLYKGLYLSENGYEVWVVPIRNYYNRLYLKTLYKVIDNLRSNDKNEEIIELCESALSINPSEEAMHIALMDSMIKLGDITNTVSHLEYATAILESELGIKSFPRFNDIQRKIQDHYKQKDENVLINLNTIIEHNQNDGAMQCSVEVFKKLYDLEKRGAHRKNEFNFICIITLDEDRIKYEENEIRQWSKSLLNVIKHSLRCGDVFALWNYKQILIILHDVRDDGLEKIENRMRKGLEDYGNYNMIIRFEGFSS